MHPTVPAPLNLSSEEISILAEMLETECARLRVEIRHTDHRSYREELRHRLDIFDSLAERFRRNGEP